MKKLRVTFTKLQENTLRHAELDSASPAYNAFNKGIAGQARNDEMAKQGTTICSRLKMILFLLIFTFSSTLVCKSQEYKEYKKIHKIYTKVYIADSLYDAKDYKNAIKFYQKQKMAIIMKE